MAVKVALFLVLLALAVVCTAAIVVNHWHINQDIEGWKGRAQVSSEPNDMLAWMKNVQAGMEKWGMTEGYSALIFTSPENDMSLIYHTVQSHVAQAEVLTKMPRNSQEYQSGLDNLRGSIRELNLHTSEYWDKHTGLFLWVFAIVLWTIVLVWFFVAIETI